MFVWYLATAVAATWYVFRDRAFDYRLLLVGSVVPLADALTGGIWVLHSITVSVAVVVVVMAATVRRRPARKRALGLPIGMMLHLVFSGAWSNTDSFWWPLFGWSLDESPLPMVDRGWGWSLLLEAAGIGLAVWLWRAASLGDPERRRRLAWRGELDFVAR